MLILSRREKEALILTDRETGKVLAEIYVTDIRASHVMIGVQAPAEVGIRRGELEARAA